MEKEQGNVVLKREGSVESGQEAEKGVNPEDIYDVQVLESGRVIIRALVAAILFLRVVEIINATVIPEGYGIAPAYFIGVLIGLGISGLFLFYMYHGRQWAKIVVYIQLILVSVSGFLLMLINGTTNLISIIIYLAFVASLMVLVLNKKVVKFLEYQKKIVKNIPVEPEELL